MHIEIISCLRDNYSYLIIDDSNNSACVVDPSESKPIINFLENKNIELRNIKNLKLTNKIKNAKIFIAYYINKVRLIDNF